MEQYKVDKKSKILLMIFIITLLASVFFTYKRTMVDKDFEIIETSTEST